MTLCSTDEFPESTRGSQPSWLERASAFNFLLFRMQQTVDWRDLRRMLSRIFAILMSVLRYLSAAKHSFFDRQKIALFVVLEVEFVESWRRDTKETTKT